MIGATDIGGQIERFDGGASDEADFHLGGGDLALGGGQPCSDPALLVLELLERDRDWIGEVRADESGAVCSKLRPAFARSGG